MLDWPSPRVAISFSITRIRRGTSRRRSSILGPMRSRTSRLPSGSIMRPHAAGMPFNHALLLWPPNRQQQDAERSNARAGHDDRPGTHDDPGRPDVLDEHLVDAIPIAALHCATKPPPITRPGIDARIDRAGDDDQDAGDDQEPGERSHAEIGRAHV